MRYKHFFTSLIFYPLYLFANSYPNSTILLNTIKTGDAHTVERSLSNEKDLGENLTLDGRSMDYPTQVIRISNVIEGQQVTCEAVNNQIDKVLINKITKDKFSYTTYISCTYDPDTEIANEFTIYSYFDPLTDDAIAYLKTYLDEYNGSDLFGTQLNIESAKALIVSLNVSVGVKKNPNTPPFIEYREDRSNFYFQNNYELQTNLISDAKKRFFSDEPDQVLPFLDKWLFNHAGTIYKAILRDSNYTMLQPERIFLMDQGEPLFVSPIKYYYAHNCMKYEHHHCLKQEL
jgi:hypothetical protein